MSPRQARTAAAALLLALLASPAPAARVARGTQTVRVAPGAALAIDAPTAVVHLAAHQERDLRIEMAVHCSGELNRCEEVARQVELAVSTGEDGTVSVRLGGPQEAWDRASRAYGDDPNTVVYWADRRDRVLFPEEGAVKRRDWTLAVSLDVRYPARSPLDVEVGAGQVEIESLAAGARVRIGRGHVLAAGLARFLGSLQLASKRGETRATTPDGRVHRGKRKGLTGGTRLELDRLPGEHRLEVEVGVKGQVVVQLY